MMAIPKFAAGASRQQIFRRVTAGLALLALALAAGCGPRVVRIGGRVLLAGQPVGEAEIVLAPVGDGSRNYRGLSLPDGSYVMDYGAEQGLKPGAYTATVSFYRTSSGQPLPPGEAGAVLRSNGGAVLKQYELPVEVALGRTQVDLQLDRGQPASR